MKLFKFLYLSITVILLSSCNSNNDLADGYGNFEAVETTISAEGNGKLIKFDVNEGQKLKKNTLVGYIDTIQLSLKKEQLQASKKVIAAKSKGVLSQINVLRSQLNSRSIQKKNSESDRFQSRNPKATG